MAAGQAGPVGSVIETGRDGMRQTENATWAEHGQLFGLLWLHPETSLLTKALIGRLQQSWHYDVAFLLQEILQLQIIYHHCRGKQDIADPLVPDAALLGSEHVLKIALTLASNVGPYHLEDFRDIIDREMRFKLLASALLLSRMSGDLSPAQADYHRIKRALVDQLEDTLKAQAAAKREGHTIQSLGNDDLFVHHALESLAETPRDVGSSALLFNAVARIFFTVDGQYNIDLAGALAQFKVPKDPSDRTKGWALQALCRLSSEAVLLAQFGFSVNDEGERKAIMAKSKQVAEWLVVKIELLFQHELSRLKRLKRRHSVATKIRITGGATAFQPSAEETRTALELLHAASHLATWFAEMKCFDIIRNLCRDLIEQSAASNQGLQPLRLKAMEVLLTIKQTRTGLSDLSSNESNLLPRPLQAVKEQTASARVLRELDISRALFMARKASSSSGIRFATEELGKHQLGAPANINCAEQFPNEGEDYPLSSAPLDSQATESNMQGQ
ncbi:MAG: hypothetical protein Q9184_006214 [Pyrenodesmia sp. 2 TL-2023]